VSEDADQAVHVLYLLGVLVLVASAFAVRRVKLGTAAKMFAGWVLIFAAAFIVFTFKDEFAALGNRLLLAVQGGEEVETSVPGETRVRLASDGHFWVEAEMNGERVRFLIDSGATTTSISRETARRVGITPSNGFPAIVKTANGTVQVQRGRAETLRVGNIQRRNVAVHISEAFGDMNVIGMNFLSSLRSWGVEGRTLILRS
jgi:aspartyl protease family protein